MERWRDEDGLETKQFDVRSEYEGCLRQQMREKLRLQASGHRERQIDG